MQIYGASFIRRQDCVKVWCVFVILHLNLEFQTVGNHVFIFLYCQASEWDNQDDRTQTQSIICCCMSSFSLLFWEHRKNYSHLYWKWDTYDELGQPISLSFLNQNGWNLFSRYTWTRCLGTQNFSSLSLVLSDQGNHSISLKLLIIN